MYLYLTADAPNRNTGGGRVVLEESRALRELAGERGEPFRFLGREELLTALRGVPNVPGDPWHWDFAARHLFGNAVKLCHLYAGTFGESVRKLKEGGAKVSYTIAAHDKEVSRREHESLGLSFPYPHLTEPLLWERYLAGYRRANVVVTPGSVPAATVRGYGADFAAKKIEVVPHGVDVPGPGAVLPEPGRFTAGYLGSVGCDKGLRVLFEAWKKLDYRDALLLIGGKDSTSDFARALWDRFGGGNVCFAGWQEDVTSFYNQTSVYVQPSVTEGWGIEVVEAAASGRPVIVSEGAGALDFVSRQDTSFGVGKWFPAGDADALAVCIDYYKNHPGRRSEDGGRARRQSTIYSWDNVRERYKMVWREMLK